MEERERPPIPVHLTVTVPGVHLPTWSAIALVLAFIFASLSFLFAAQEISALRVESAAKADELRREIRMLQLHAQDIENVLIRARVASRDDFAPWGPSNSPQPPERRK